MLEDMPLFRFLSSFTFLLSSKKCQGEKVLVWLRQPHEVEVSTRPPDLLLFSKKCNEKALTLEWRSREGPRFHSMQLEEHEVADLILCIESIK
jgi:hypothetical protein